MSDPRSQPEHEEEDGASPSEQLIEASRRNNTELLLEVIESCGNSEKAAALLNNTKTVLGNYIYHEAALRGNYEVIDVLLDQEGFECDPISTREGDTPLHSAIRFINSQPLSAPSDEPSAAMNLVTMMLEAGSDPSIRNKAKLTAAQLLDPANVEVKRAFVDAAEAAEREREIAAFEAEYKREEVHEDDYAGSGSDSDFDPAEFKREQEARKKALA
ncbi:ankyrin repeat protein [Phlyctema vagabunda]|uniref:Ankyrin repeat protein n=1 Tax=Phlyctema vagabunda TaxID=108571 RepID=A0ABR4PT76_9HELO